MKRTLQTFAIVLVAALTVTVAGSASGQPNDNENRRYGHQRERRSITVVCESNDGQRHRCAADTLGEITLSRQRSRRSKCVEGRSWGSDRRGIWVDHGCRAEFLIADNAGQYRDRRAGQPTQTVVCESSGKGRTYCRAANRFGVDLTRELSRSSCVADRTWGSDANGVWVSNGCRAEFSMRSRM